jgi:glycosyltransferase involved in cell wall biosynthesis
MANTKQKKLRIAQIAPLWFSIPPRKYGGTERIIHHLTEGLAERGYEVTLFASGDSKTKAKLKSVTKESLIKRNIPWFDWWWNTFNHSVAFEKASEFDIVHCHWNILGAYFQRFIKTPVLFTFHNTPLPSDHRWKIFEYYKKDLNVVFISKKQKENSPVRFKKEWVVYNGIDIKKFPFGEKPKNFFLWAGRISPAKGTHTAVEIAEKLGLNLLIGGQLQPMYKDYFEKKIKPRLSRKIKYIGELTQKQLAKLYKEAKALIYPIEWEEPFGLVVVESMACGTPVIAFERGSMMEVIKNGKTGFVVKDAKGAIQAVRKINGIKRADCRRWVEENFTIEKMVSNYEKVYNEIITGKKL